MSRERGIRSHFGFSFVLALAALPGRVRRCAGQQVLGLGSKLYPGRGSHFYHPSQPCLLCVTRICLQSLDNMNGMAAATDGAAVETAGEAHVRVIDFMDGRCVLSQDNFDEKRWEQVDASLLEHSRFPRRGARGIGGDTIHSCCHMHGETGLSLKSLSRGVTDGLKDRWLNVMALIIEEISLVSPRLLGAASYRICCARQNTHCRSRHVCHCSQHVRRNSDRDFAWRFHAAATF